MATPPSGSGSGGEGGREVAIAGFGPSRKWANTLPPHVEIWGMNKAYTFLTRWDRWFDLHLPETYTDAEVRDAILAWCQQASVPVYHLRLDPTVPKSTLYPLVEIVKEFGRMYFTSSIAYLIALALYEGVDKLYLCGVNLDQYTEYDHQRPCAEYWIGRAEERGVEVWLSNDSQILQGHLYGATPMPITSGMVKDQLALLMEQKEATLKAYHLLEGARDSAAALMEQSEGKGITQEQLEAAHKQYEAAMKQQENQWHTTMGAVQALNSVIKAEQPAVSNGDAPVSTDAVVLAGEKDTQRWKPDGELPAHDPNDSRIRAVK